MDKHKKKIKSVIISNLREKKRIYCSKAIILCAGPFGNVYLIKNLLDKNISSGRNLCDKPQINFYNIKFNLVKKFNRIKVFFLKKKSNYEISTTLQFRNYFMGTHLTVDTNIYEKRTNLFKFFIEIKNK